MQIEITQRNIDQGRQSSGRDCAIARAMKEQLSLVMGRVPDVWVDRNRVVVDGRMSPATPEIHEFVSKFDHDKALVSPIVITLSPYFPDSHGMSPYDRYAYVGAKPDMMVFDEGAAPSHSVTMAYPDNHYEKMYNEYKFKNAPMPKFPTGDWGKY